MSIDHLRDELEDHTPAMATSAESRKVKRVIETGQVKALFRREIIKRMGIDIERPKDGEIEKVTPVLRTIREMCDNIRENIIWGLYGADGQLLRMTEIGSVEQLGPEDAPKFQELYLRGLREEPSSFGSTYEIEAGKNNEEVEEFIRSRYVVGTKFTYLDEAGKVQQKLVGIAHMRREEGVSSHIAYFGTLYVHPAHRGRGLARNLSIHRLNYAKEQGIEQAHMVVTASNKFVRDFTRRLGFRETGTHHQAVRIDGVYYDWVYMMLEMSKYQPKTK